MAEDTNIEWADHTFNPWMGCTNVSPACDHCYAETLTARFGRVGWGAKAERVRTSDAYWKGPRRWNRDAEQLVRAGLPRPKVFCASLADVFDNHRSIDPEWREELWLLIRATPNLDWLLLTKRPQNIQRFMPGGYWPNVWLGVTVENRDEMYRRGSELAYYREKVAQTFWSCEPLLGDLGEIPPQLMPSWIIMGGESGYHARPTHPDWFRSIRDQCKAVGTPLLFKQWGEWTPWEPTFVPCWKNQCGDVEDGNCLFPENMDNDPNWDDGLAHLLDHSHCVFQRVGKKNAGRLLDGVLHNEFPA